MLIYFANEIKDGPIAGGHNFLRTLKNRLAQKSLVTDCYKCADVVLYNGHQDQEKVRLLKKQYPDKAFIHRMDGLQKLYNKPTDHRQDVALSLNRLADGTIFQSEWAKKKFREFGWAGKYYTVIHNAANPHIFNGNKRELGMGNGKFKILTTSWSSNMKKGFELYKYLDENLDFGKFDYYFLGNSPLHYKNIIHVPPTDSLGIAYFMSGCHLFISAVQDDACSNSIIEALTMGLPTFVLNSGGNPELGVDPRHIFADGQDAIAKITQWLSRSITPNQNPPSLDIQTLKYQEFCESCLR
jgi:glycosyltransferase involved in cell wall biosynthesis